jgi:hypothetical protein
LNYNVSKEDMNYIETKLFDIENTIAAVREKSEKIELG